MDRRVASRKIWFHRSRSVAWMVVAVMAWPLGWVYSVAFVSMASLYANITSDWANSEAADNREVIELLTRIVEGQARLDARQERIENLLIRLLERS